MIRCTATAIACLVVTAHICAETGHDDTLLDEDARRKGVAAFDDSALDAAARHKAGRDITVSEPTAERRDADRGDREVRHEARDAEWIGGRRAWLRFQGGERMDGFADRIGPNTPLVRWKMRTNGWCGSPVVDSDGTVYFFDSNRGLTAVDRYGQRQWIFRLPPTSPPPDLSPAEGREWRELGLGGSTATHAPALDTDGTVYIGVTFHPHPTPEGARLGLYAVRPGGKLKWFFETGDPVTSSPNIGADGTIYFSTSRALIALATDGSEKWRHARDGDRVKWSTPAIGRRGLTTDLPMAHSPKSGSENRIPSTGLTEPGMQSEIIYVVGRKLLALAPDGKLVWAYQPHDGRIKGFAAHPTVAGDGTVFFAAGTWMYAVNPDGSERWRRDIGWTESSPALDANGTIFIGARSDTGKSGALLAMEPTRGAKIWSFPVRTYIDSSPAVGRDGTVYFGSDDGIFYAVTTDGRQCWTLDVGARARMSGEIDTSPALGPDGTLFFGHAGGPGEKGGLFFYAVRD